MNDALGLIDWSESGTQLYGFRGCFGRMANERVAIGNQLKQEVFNLPVMAVVWHQPDPNARPESLGLSDKSSEFRLKRSVHARERQAVSNCLPACREGCIGIQHEPNYGIGCRCDSRLHAFKQSINVTDGFDLRVCSGPRFRVVVHAEESHEIDDREKIIRTFHMQSWPQFRIQHQRTSIIC